MKIILTGTFLFFLFAAFNAKSQTVTLNFEKVKIPKVLKEISKQTSISIVYKEAMFEKLDPVTINVKNVTVQEALDKCFENQPFTYTMDGNTITVKKNNVTVSPPPASPKQSNYSVINGVVLSATKEKLEGATIQLKAGAIKNVLSNLKNAMDSGDPIGDEANLFKGQIKNLVTNAQGMFSIVVPKGKYKLTITSIGHDKYETSVIATKDSVSVAVNMKMTDKTEKEVVVNGLFSRPKENFTGAATSFTGDQLRQVSPTSILTALKTLDASFQMPTDVVNGSNPNVIPKFQVRGTNSILQNDLTSEYGYISNPPLIILNGFEITVQQLYDLDINNIAKVTILKDAAATAIYGSKSANGVLVLETKQPKTGEVQIMYTGNLTANMPDLSSYNMMDAQEKINFEQIAGAYKSRNYSIQNKLNDQYNLVLHNVQRGVNTYWASQPLQTEFNHTHNITLSAGANKVIYMAQLSYSHNGGIMKGSGRNNLGGNINVRYNGRKFKLQTQFLIGSVKGNNSPYGDFGDYTRLNPYWMARDENGNVTKYVDIYPIGTVDGSNVNLPNPSTPQFINPLYNTTLHTVNNTSNLNIGQNIWTEWELVRSLKLTSTFSYSQTTGEDNVFLPALASQFFNTSDFSRKGSFNKSTIKNFDYQSNILLNYGKILGMHTIFATGGVNLQQTSSQSLNIYATGFPSSRLDDLLFALRYGTDKPSGSYDMKRTVGFLGNASYAFDNRYLLDLSFRTDGSSVFGANKRFGDFWSVGAGWNVEKEKFFTLPKAISRLKLRGSYGFTGSINFPGYASSTTYRYIGDGRYLDFIPASIIALGNPDLVWQRTKKLDLGTDLSLFNDRIGVTFDYYKETTDDLIMQNPSPPSTGFSSFYNNLGKSENTGYSISLNTFILRNPTKKLYWSVNASWFANKNKVLNISDVMRDQNKSATDKLNDTSQHFNKPVLQYKEGTSISTLYAVRSLGIDPSNGREIFLTKDGKQTYIWNVNDMVAVGDAQPKFNMTFNNYFQYKWIRLNFGLNIVLGGVQYNSTLADKLENANIALNVDRRALDNRWQKPGDVADYKGLTDVEGYPIRNSETKPTSRFIRKNNAVTLTGLSIDPGQLLARYITKYTNLLVNKMNNKMNDAIKSDMLDVRFVMNNAFSFGGVKREQGTAYPLNRTYTLNITLRF